MLRLEIVQSRITQLTPHQSTIDHLLEKEGDVFGCEALGRLAAGRMGPEEFDSFDDWWSWITIQEPSSKIDSAVAFGLGLPLAQRWVEENVWGSDLESWMIDIINSWNTQQLELGVKILGKVTRGIATRTSTSIIIHPLELSLVFAYLCGRVPHIEEELVERALEAHGINTKQVVEVFDI